MSELIGTLIKLGVALFLVAVAVVIGVRTFGSSEVVAEQQRLSTIVSNIKTLYANTPTYDGLTTTVAINAGVFPSDMVSGTTVRNRWKGNVTVSSTATTFTITYNNVPKDACIQLVSNFKDSNLTQVVVNGTALATVPPSPAEASGACTSDRSNTIDWTFR